MASKSFEFRKQFMIDFVLQINLTKFEKTVLLDNFSYFACKSEN